MRDMCKSSAVVAAVVAVLEKQQNSNVGAETDEKRRGRFSSMHRQRPASPQPAKFSQENATASSAFENAVKDFHSVAEDVEKICSGRQLRRVPVHEYGPAAAIAGRSPQAPPRRSTQQQVKQVPQNYPVTKEPSLSPSETRSCTQTSSHHTPRKAPEIPQKPFKPLQNNETGVDNILDCDTSRRYNPQDVNGEAVERKTRQHTEQRSTTSSNEFEVTSAGGTIFQIQQSGWSNSGDIVKVFQVPQSYSHQGDSKSFSEEDSRSRPLKVCDRAPSGSQTSVIVVQQDEDDDSTTPDPSSSDDSDVEREHVINEGLATIVEELGSLHSYGGADDDSSLEEEEEEVSRTAANGSGGTVKKEEAAALGGGEGCWSNRGSSSDVSSTAGSCSSSSESPLKDSSTRCNGDFRWISKQDQNPSSASMASMASIEESGEPPPTAKPPLNACKPPIRPHKPPGNYQLSGSSGSLEKPPRILERPGGSLERPGAHLDKPSRSGTLDRPGGSLDRRRQHHQNRQERDQRSRSGSHVIHVPTTPPPRLEDFTRCQGWCCNSQGNNQHDWLCFQKRHERLDPQRYGSNPALEHHRQPSRYSDYTGSHPDIYSDFSNGNGIANHFNRHHEMSPCCPFHVPPPPCYCFDMPPHRGGGFNCWTPPPYHKSGGDQDEKLRKLQCEKDNLQLQVQVLSEQIEAQADKISDLEKMLIERKLHLSETEEKLQKEMLSRSSLETQKLELMSIMSELKLQQAALERENLELRSSQHNNNSEVKKPPLMPRMHSQPQLTSTPVHHASNQSSSSYKRQIDIKYGSLPRQQFLANGDGGGIGGGGNDVTDNNANPSALAGKKGVVFAADTERDDGTNETPGSPNVSFNKNKGIKKIFGKMRRSGSGNLEDIPGVVGEFQRGGIRATASARLGWNDATPATRPDKPFAEWDAENICDWLQDLGLDSYVLEAKRWVQSGQQLQETSIGEIEKELNIKNPLHRKKLQLALIDMQENGSSDPYLAQAGKLDTAWVLRWLDDTGLPQHKENFLINRVDGRVLHRLTMDDLALLHVTSLLHVASIKRGIQVLRENNYDPACLQRRSLPDDPSQPTPKQISLWTTHRVMEWLRAVDLAEYAPNLRGAGVHGGLMVLEPKFNAELLAALLSIPPGKTLLRRHLNTHFKELLGKDIIQEKREAESMLGYVPLTPASKMKIPKKSQFSLKRKKSKGEADYGDLVCPLNPDKSDEEDGKRRGRGCLSSSR
ncbi:unnamed protein product [Acanthoscelides obtectus]|uniref:SAM domain-containing protein n=1 Tax=Acanthoscelides obtectus TaxID=200917 RepID=A0A9P0KWW6_ACAOB|nr:unnamed protein product [Acanthoscelides obtectus]CAK1644026.1 Liprin-beta-1 [Acanthoscelides obtectus]